MKSVLNVLFGVSSPVLVRLMRLCEQHETEPYKIFYFEKGDMEKFINEYARMYKYPIHIPSMQQRLMVYLLPYLPTTDRNLFLSETIRIRGTKLMRLVDEIEKHRWKNNGDDRLQGSIDINR